MQEVSLGEGDMEGITIVCFLWYGDRWGKDDMGAIYTQRLVNGVRRNLSIQPRIVCLTDLPLVLDGAEIIRFDPPSRLGCLPKLCMFDPGLGFRGQVLSLDIDIVVTGSLDELAGYRGPFCVRSKFLERLKHQADGDIVGFRAEDREVIEQVWDPFIHDVKAAESFTGGRERFWYRRQMDCLDRWQDLFPGQVVSYKRHVRGIGRLPAEARLVSCHGRPRPHEIREAWVTKHWI